jgi:hypothetical protein
MGEVEVLVVGETPSLGRSITDLLIAGNIRAHYAMDLGDGRAADLPDTAPVVVLASNGSYSPFVRRWVERGPTNVALVVVGSRDTILARSWPGVHLVPLPLAPARFLEQIQDQLTLARRGGRSGPSPD